MTSSHSGGIVAILPQREGFGTSQYGAIALSVRDFTYASRFRAHTLVVSGVDQEGYEGITYLPQLRKKRWYENRTRAYAADCLRVIKQEQPALVEIHNRPNLVHILYGKVACLLALHLHNDAVTMRGAKTPAERRTILSRCAVIYCVSEYVRQRFLEGLEGISPEMTARLQIVHCGLELPPAPPPVSQKKPYFVFTGRMTEEKGAVVFARALALALPQLPSWGGIVIGSGRHAAAHDMNDYEREVARILEPLGKRVHQPGFLPHSMVMAHFAQGEVAVIPSLWPEPFGRTALEAMAQGCAIISSGTGGLREITAEAALYPSPFTAEKLAEGMIALAQNDALRRDLQSQAWPRAQAFSIHSVTNRLDMLREQVIASA